jgi:hypothetical protein
MSGANYRQHYSMKAERRKVGNCITEIRWIATGQVYKTFTFQLPVFIELSPAFAIVLVRAGVLLQVTKVETPKVAWSSLRFGVFFHGILLALISTI